MNSATVEEPLISAERGRDQPVASRVAVEEHVNVRPTVQEVNLLRVVAQEAAPAATLR